MHFGVGEAPRLVCKPSLVDSKSALYHVSLVLSVLLLTEKEA